MEFDIDAAARQATAQFQAMRKAQETPPEQIDTGRLLPLFVPVGLCTKVWCGPYYRLRNMDIGLTWCALLEGGVIGYVTHQQSAHWESKGVDWRRLALTNLAQQSKKETGITVVRNRSGVALAIAFHFESGLGSSHLLRRQLLSKEFPEGYRVAIPDRRFGMAFRAGLGQEDSATVDKIVQHWHAKGGYALASGAFEPDELLPQRAGDLERHLTYLGENRTCEALQSALDAFRRGDYEEALRQAEGLKLVGEETSSYCFHRGAYLGHLGRVEESEVWLRRAAEMHEEDGKARRGAIALSVLGEVMVQEGRYEEAEACFERSIAQFPKRGSGYRHMAELRLFRGDAAGEALSWAERAVSHEEADAGISHELRKANLSEDFATLAWAAAAASQDAARVSQLAGEALANLNDNSAASSASSRAQAQYQVGRAFAELGDSPLAARHYGEGARLDPNGYWGRVSRAALEKGL